MTTTVAPFERLAPMDLEAEAAVIAAALTEPESLPELAGLVAPSDFIREKNGWVFSAILDVFSRGEAVNEITVAHRLATLDRLDDIGGRTYLADCIRDTPTTIGNDFYAKIVKNTARRRQIIHATTGIAQMAYEVEDPDAILDRAGETISRLTESRRRQLTWTAHEAMSGAGDELGVMDRLHLRLDDPEYVQGYAFGWEELEDIIGGLVPTQLTTLLADTSVGKSFVAQNIAWQLGIRGISVFYVSTEMSFQEVFERVVSMQAGFMINQFDREHRPTTGQMLAIQAAAATIDQAPIRVMDSGMVQFRTLEAEARRSIDSGVQVLIVDHLNDVRISGRDRVQEMEEAVAGLKSLAMRYRVPVFVCGHINRDSAKNGLSLHSAKWGAAVEQYSNNVLLLEAVEYESSSARWIPLSESETNEQSRKGWIRLRVQAAKVRAGAKNWTIRALSWNNGGRLIAPEDVLL
jgi:replicative DNA helicase